MSTAGSSHTKYCLRAFVQTGVGFAAPDLLCCSVFLLMLFSLAVQLSHVSLSLSSSEAVNFAKHFSNEIPLDESSDWLAFASNVVEFFIASSRNLFERFDCRSCTSCSSSSSPSLSLLLLSNSLLFLFSLLFNSFSCD